jgi:Family of unknown function (DUF6184)
MNTIKVACVLGHVLMGFLVACASSPASEASSPQAIVPETKDEPGATNEQAVADADVVERISSARCDRSQSCDRIGPGANYRDRDDCMSQMRALMSRQLSASRCPGGMGEVGVSRCVKSLHDAECDSPGQELYPRPSHCELGLMCIK